MVPLFVYGSLRRGAEEHHKMEGAKFVESAHTVPRYRLVPVRSFHALTTGSESVSGELFEVSMEKLLELDDWEYGIFARHVIELEGGKLADAYMLVVRPIIQRIVARYLVGIP